MSNHVIEKVKDKCIIDYSGLEITPICGLEITKFINGDTDNIKTYNTLQDLIFYLVNEKDLLFFKPYTLIAYSLKINDVHDIKVFKDRIDLIGENKVNTVMINTLEKWINEYSLKLSHNNFGSLFVTKTTDEIENDNGQLKVQYLAYSNDLRKYTSMNGVIFLLDDKTNTLYLSITGDEIEYYNLSTMNTTDVTVFEDKINIIYSGTSVTLTKEDIINMIDEVR